MRENAPPTNCGRSRSIRTILDFADGSALIEVGKTRVVAAATIEEKVPPFLKARAPAGSRPNTPCCPRHREADPRASGPRAGSLGRSQEIQRLIGRALRAVTDMQALGERQIILDCDVIQADGGTRTASINAACVALALALKKLLDERNHRHDAPPPSRRRRSVGIVRASRSSTSTTPRTRRPRPT